MLLYGLYGSTAQAELLTSCVPVMGKHAPVICTA